MNYIKPAEKDRLYPEVASSDDDAVLIMITEPVAPPCGRRTIKITLNQVCPLPSMAMETHQACPRHYKSFKSGSGRSCVTMLLGYARALDEP